VFVGEVKAGLGGVQAEGGDRWGAEDSQPRQTEVNLIVRFATTANRGKPNC